MISRHSLCLALSFALLPLHASAAPLDIAGRAHDGRMIAAGTLSGWRLVYFGYTHCPDVCPMGLATIGQAIDKLGPLGERITPIFITVDPERDTPELLKNYVDFFHPRLVGITPSSDELKAMAEGWRIKYQRVEGSSPQNYSMDHTASIFLLNPQGAVAGRFAHDLSAEQLVDKIKLTILRSP